MSFKEKKEKVFIYCCLFSQITVIFFEKFNQTQFNKNK